MSGNSKKNRYRKRDPKRHRRDYSYTDRTLKRKNDVKTGSENNFTRTSDNVGIEERQTEEQLVNERIGRLKNSLYALDSNLEQPLSEIAALDISIKNIEDRISDLRRMNYHNLIHLEKDQSDLDKIWNIEKPHLKIAMNEKITNLKNVLSSLQKEISRSDNLNSSNLEQYESSLSNIRNNYSKINSQTVQQLMVFKKNFNDLDKDITIAEKTIKLLSKPSFSWKQQEHPLISVQAEDVEKNLEGILTLTNQRFLFESEKEIVLKKVLFIATEKKMMRQVVINQPIGIIETIDKGRVSFLKGTGLYIKFKPKSHIKEMKLDTTDKDAENVLRFFEFIVSGEADIELDTIKDYDKTEDVKDPEIFCPLCNAPYRLEIYRGQTTVQCNYCGTMIRI